MNGPILYGGYVDQVNFGLIIGVTVLVVVLGLVVLAVASIANGRSQSDPAGERLSTVYVAFLSWVGLFAGLFASFGFVSTLVSLIGRQRSAVESLSQIMVGGPGLAFGQGSSGSSTQPAIRPEVVNISSPVASPAVAFAIATGAAVLLLVAYRHRLRGLLDRLEAGQGSSARPMRAYIVAVCLVAILTALAAGASGLYGIYKTVAPGSAGVFGGSRTVGIHMALDSAYLAALSLLIFRAHRRWLFPAAPEPPPAE